MSDRDPIRAARDAALTSRLLGVDFLPRRSGDDAAFAAAAASGDSSVPAAEVEAKPSDDRAARLAELRARYERESVVAKEMPGWTNVVFGDGSPNALLMFVGEAPGADEDASGVPFVGRAGRKLDEMIAAMGLDRQRDCYIANVLKVRPPNNRTPTVDEAASEGPYLEAQIHIIRPRVIVTLGRPAANFLLRTTASMGQLRGCWHEFDGIPVMPTYHPAYLLRAYTPENRKRVWSDLQMALAELRAQAGGR